MAKYINYISLKSHYLLLGERPNRENRDYKDNRDKPYRERKDGGDRKKY